MEGREGEGKEGWRERRRDGWGGVGKEEEEGKECTEVALVAATEMLHLQCAEEKTDGAVRDDTPGGIWSRWRKPE